jgi:hypothetical protein
MAKEMLQLENLNGQDFKNEIIDALKDEFQKLALSAKDNDVLLSRQQTAELLSVSLVTLWDWTRKDIIPGFKIGNKVRYKKFQVIEALQKINKL